MNSYFTHSPEETETLAFEFSKNLKKGESIALCGALGAGKTCFVHGLFNGLGGDEAYFVSSPTFTLLQEYPTKKGPLYHFDLYRLNNYREFCNLDFEEFLHSKGISVFEWGDKWEELKNHFDYLIRFKRLGEYEREIIIEKRKQ